MISKQILYVDMDGVIADFEGGIKAIKPDIVWGEQEVDDFCTENPDIFHNLPEIDGAIDAINNLKDYYEIYFLSTPMFHIPESYMGKRIWLKSKFGEWCDKRLILTHRKDLCIGHYLVDDRPTKNGANGFKGKLIHFDVTNPEFKGWEEVLEKLMDIWQQRLALDKFIRKKKQEEDREIKKAEEKVELYKGIPGWVDLPF